MSAAGGGFGRRIAANSLHAASGRIVALVVWLVYTPWLLQALGPERFGLWSLFFAIATTLVSLDLGLHQATLRFVAGADARDDTEAAGAFATLGLLTFIVLGALWLALALLLREPLISLLRFPEASRSDAGFVIVAGALVFALMGITQVVMAIAQGFGRFDLANRAMLVMSGWQAISIPVVLTQGWELRGLIGAMFLAWLLGLLTMSWFVQRALPRFRWGMPEAAVARLREAMAFGVPMQAAVAGLVGHQHVDKVLLVPLVSLATVAPYELGFRVSNAALSVVQLFLLAVIPAAAALHAHQDREKTRELYRRGNRYVLSAAVLFFTVLAASADRLFLVWLGEPHPEAALALRALSLASALFSITGMGTSVARGFGRTDIEAWYAMIALAAHVVLALVCMPSFGLAGALFAMVAGTFLGVTFFLWRFAQVMGWSKVSTLLEPHVVPVVAASAGVLLGGWVDGWMPASARLPALIAVAGSSGLIVVAVIRVTGYLRWTELQALMRRGVQAVRP